MSYVANLVESRTQSPQRSNLLSVSLGALAVGLLFAFWLVCSHQMRKAETRRDEAVVQQMALSDCLQYIPGSTIASCSARSNSDAQAEDARLDKPALTATVPVSFSFH